MQLLYNIAAIIIVILIIPMFMVRSVREKGFVERIRQSLGFFPEHALDKVEKKDCIWVHAASVGEIVATSPLIKEFHKEQDGKRFIVFLYVACRFSGELRASAEGDVFWYLLSELKRSKELADGFSEMLPVFTSDEISEVFYTKNWDTVFC